MLTQLPWIQISERLPPERTWVLLRGPADQSSGSMDYVIIGQYDEEYRPKLHGNIRWFDQNLTQITDAREPPIDWCPLDDEGQEREIANREEKREQEQAASAALAIPCPGCDASAGGFCRSTGHDWWAWDRRKTRDVHAIRVQAARGQASAAERQRPDLPQPVHYRAGVTGPLWLACGLPFDKENLETNKVLFSTLEEEVTCDACLAARRKRRQDWLTGSGTMKPIPVVNNPIQAVIAHNPADLLHALDLAAKHAAERNAFKGQRIRVLRAVVYEGDAEAVFKNLDSSLPVGVKTLLTHTIIVSQGEIEVVPCSACEAAWREWGWPCKEHGGKS